MLPGEPTIRNASNLILAEGPARADGGTSAMHTSTASDRGPALRRTPAAFFFGSQILRGRMEVP